MRAANEITDAHDLLAGLFDHIEVARHVLPAPLYVRAMASADVLCWLLEHEGNPCFGLLLDDVKKRLRAAAERITNGAEE